MTSNFECFYGNAQFKSTSVMGLIENISQISFNLKKL